MEKHKTFFLDGFEVELQKYIEVFSYTKDEVTYKFILSDKAFNSSGIIDEGLVIALIDSYSSYSCFLIGKDTGKYSLSMNLKLTNLNHLKRNNDYFMKVKILDENKSSILFDIHILDEHGKLIKKASHFKKIISSKF